MMMGNFWYGNMGWLGMILGAIFCLALLVGLVILVVWAIRRVSRPSSQTSQNRSTKDIAKERYAKGEINRDEYQKILSDLDR